MEFDETYWDNRYKNGTTGWDIGHISTPLKTYFDQLEDRSLQILIPGGGNSYEAQYLFEKGFQNVFVLDLSETALSNIQKRMPSFPKEQLIHQNFFDFEGSFDLIIEQTFFCALHPSLRKAYAEKMHQLLQPNGKLVGLLFDFPLTEEGPPFGGSLQEYDSYFSPLFKIDLLERAYNSIPPRAGKELFLKLLKK
ncbi:MAG: SAM-dependent methyltransferase [Alteromonas sp.]|nr:SAM-dependent methyltransferase [Alteromonas sp.]MAY23857.1 SAM-dependent methyltransferase [Flavobacteriaceae bacterium]|tara:strand:+ start:61965 stop:62546 length:582 start_codon:yes stop_codon:yes gene_type:complete